MNFMLELWTTSWCLCFFMVHLLHLFLGWLCYCMDGYCDRSVCLSVIGDAVDCGQTVQDRPIHSVYISRMGMQGRHFYWDCFWPSSPNGFQIWGALFWKWDCSQIVTHKTKPCIDRHWDIMGGLSIGTTLHLLHGAHNSFKCIQIVGGFRLCMPVWKFCSASAAVVP